MRIAFVGKGGSGKTTVTSLFSLYMQSKNLPIYIFDADVNVHMSEILLGKSFPEEKYLSNADNANPIKDFLKGDNHRIDSMAQFRKTTPPTSQSGFIKLQEKDNVLANCALNCNGIPVYAVGPHSVDKIGTSCYHAKLEILETVLNHLHDKDEVVVCDMVAGTDSFSCTLHMQFDLLVLVVEPTKQSLSVYKQFLELSAGAGVESNLRVIANKVLDEDDKDFIRQNIADKHLLGFVNANKTLKKLERQEQAVTQDILDDDLNELFNHVYKTLSAEKDNSQSRYEKLLAMHEKYSSSVFIQDLFGDLARQIDLDFNPCKK